MEKGSLSQESAGAAADRLLISQGVFPLGSGEVGLCVSGSVKGSGTTGVMDNTGGASTPAVRLRCVEPLEDAPGSFDEEPGGAGDMSFVLHRLQTEQAAARSGDQTDDSCRSMVPINGPQLVVPHQFHASVKRKHAFDGHNAEWLNSAELKAELGVEPSWVWNQR